MMVVYESISLIALENTNLKSISAVLHTTNLISHSLSHTLHEHCGLRLMGSPGWFTLGSIALTNSLQPSVKWELGTNKQGNSVNLRHNKVHYLYI